MILSIQFDEAADLLWELLRAVPEDQRANFSERVNRVACCLSHPSSLDTDVFLSLGSDYAIKRPVALSDVVLPMEGTQVA